MQNGTFIRVFIASPGDVHVEREEACRVIHSWNAAHSIARSVLIEPVRVETHSRVVQGGHPQDLINGQLLERCDLLVAILWSRLGTPTAKDLSGTVQEIHEFAETHGPENVLLFFCDRPYPSSVDLDQVQAVRAFKESVQSEGLYRPYTEPSEFAELFRQQLDMAMNEILGSDHFANASAELQSQSEKLHPEACSVLAVAAVAERGQILLSRMLAGHELSIGGIVMNKLGDQRSEAVWEGGLDQLERCGLIEDLGDERSVFRVTREGYEETDELWTILLLRRINSLQAGEYSYVNMADVLAEPFLGCTIDHSIARQRVSALAQIDSLEIVPSDGGISAVRLNDMSKKLIREHGWISFADPNLGDAE